MSNLSSKIYDKSPAFLQNIGISIYGLGLYFREYGKKFNKVLDEFEKQQWLSYSELLDYQNEKLRKLIKHAYDNVPYYHKIMNERDLYPQNIETVDDLHKLPILTSNDIRNNINDLIAKYSNKSSLIEGHTSGTTGSPLQFYYDKNICLVKNVVDWRQKGIAGIKPFDKVAYFLGRTVVHPKKRKPPFWRHNWILNHLFMSSFHLSKENLTLYYKKLIDYEPKAIEGYPSTLFIMASYLLKMNKTLPMKAVFTSSETLYPHQRETIEKAFACKLFDFYGLAERVAFATECTAHKGHHLNMDFGITELLDKNHQPVTKGNLGRIVATGFHNNAMPLIRYLTSDVTAIGANLCSCSREFPLMDDVTTKAEDIITTPDGKYISSSVLTHPFKPIHGIIESQIIQENLDSITIKIVKSDLYKEEDSLYLINEMNKRIGANVKINLNFVNKIPRTKAGKFRWVISKVPLEF